MCLCTAVVSAPTKPPAKLPSLSDADIDVIIGKVGAISAASKKVSDELETIRVVNTDLQATVSTQRTRIEASDAALQAVSSATMVVQNVVNIRTTERDSARAEVAKLKKEWWHLFWWSTIQTLTIIGLVVFIFRKSIAGLVIGMPI